MIIGERMWTKVPPAGESVGNFRCKSVRAAVYLNRKSGYTFGDGNSALTVPAYSQKKYNRGKIYG